MPLEEVFFEVGIILIIAALFSMVIYRLRQPLILAYILTGVVAGPSVLSLANNSEIFEIMSKIGVAFLLFTVGLGLNWKSVKDVGGIALATGVGQVLFTSVVGFFIGLLLKFDPVTSAYLSVALAFSSTIIIVKLLMDKEDLDALYGRISVGFLLVQDFIAMLILLALSGLRSGFALQDIFTNTLMKGIVIVPIFWFISAKILPRVLHYVSKSQELLFIFAVAWCLLVANVLAYFGFGVEVGALIAGITLSTSVYVQEIIARIKPLRDFFLVMFFIVLGTHLGLEHVAGMLVPMAVFSLYILIVNPLIVLFIMRSLGYHPRTGFLAGTTVAQISEFSFIVIGAGIAAGHLHDSILALVTVIGIITIAASYYLIEHNERIYNRIAWMFKRFEPRHLLEIEKQKHFEPKHTILFGCHDTGRELLPVIQSMKKPYIVVDFDPQITRQLSEREIPTVYGDAGDEGFLEEIKADKAKLIISTIPDVVISSALLGFFSAKKFKGTIVVSVHTNEEAEMAYELGATYVIIPSILSGRKFSEMLVAHKASRRSWAALEKLIT